MCNFGKIGLQGPCLDSFPRMECTKPSHIITRVDLTQEPAGRPAHICKNSCCATPEEAKEKAANLFRECLLRPIAVPALNKWTKVFPCIGACVLLSFFGDVGQHVFSKQFGKHDKHETDTLSELDSSGDAEDEALRVPVNEVKRWKKLARKRNAKATSFMCDENSRFINLPWLHIAAPCMRLHWVLFKTATWYSDRPKTTEDERPTVTLKDFCNPATNPGQKVLFELVQLLRDPARGFSAVCFFFGRFQDWPQARKRVALRSILIVVGQLVRKIIEPFNTYPWQLATLADPDSDERIRRICARELFQAPPCCVDSGCSARLRATSVDACVSSDFMEFFQVLFERVVLTSTFVERRFAHFSHWTDVKGKGTSLCLLAAKHVTRTFKDVVDLWKKRTLPDTARGGTTNASRPSWCRKSQAAARLNGYHMFSQDRAADRDRSCQGAEESAAFLDDALQAWRALPEEEKQTWSQRARENNARKSALQMAAAAEMPPDVPGGPWNLSVPSEQWPLSEKFLGEFLESCGGFSTARNHWVQAGCTCRCLVLVSQGGLSSSAASNGYMIFMRYYEPILAIENCRIGNLNVYC